MAYYHPPTKLREGNVFSHVCLSTGVEEEGWSLPWCILPHCTESPHPNQTWDTSPLPRHGIWEQLYPLLVTSGSHHWKPVQICSLDLTVQFPAHWYWQLVATEACRLASAWYTSYWNAFLFKLHGTRYSVGNQWRIQDFLRGHQLPNWAC